MKLMTCGIIRPGAPSRMVEPVRPAVPGHDGTPAWVCRTPLGGEGRVREDELHGGCLVSAKVAARLNREITREAAARKSEQRAADKRARGVRDGLRVYACGHEYASEIPREKYIEQVALPCERCRTMDAIKRGLREMGFTCERRARKSSRSSYYHLEIGKEVLRVRVSDHYLPHTPEREHYHGLGLRSYDMDIVVDCLTDAAREIADVFEVVEEMELGAAE